MEEIKNITWQELKDFVNSIPEELLQKEAVLLYEDETYAKNLSEPFFIQNDIYSNIEDSEDCGTVDELKDIWGDEFDEKNYRLVTKIGTPFLYIS